MEIKSFKTFIKENVDTAIVTFGRFNPPTIGHEKLMDKLASVSKTRNGKYFIFASVSNDPKKNPLSYEQKIKFMRKMFPKHARSIILDKSIKNMFDVVVSMYDKGYKKVVIVVGQDRVNEFKTLINKYNGQKARHGFYNFEGGVEVVSAGDRDPDSDDVTGMSASKMRAAASDNDFDSFSKALPSNFSGAKELFNAVRNGMGLQEEVDQPLFNPVSETREAYVRGELFEEGQAVMVKSTQEPATIKRLCSNYVIVETSKNPAKRVWLNNLEQVQEDISQKQLDELEKFADKLLAKFDIDIEFTRHFVDRVNDDRNTPDIKIAELQKFFKKIHKAKGNKIKTVNDLQAVLKDITTQINIPAVIKRKPMGDFEVVMKTIMRKKDFKSTSPSVEYK